MNKEMETLQPRRDQLLESIDILGLYEERRGQRAQIWGHLKTKVQVESVGVKWGRFWEKTEAVITASFLTILREGLPGGKNRGEGIVGLRYCMNLGLSNKV